MKDYIECADIRSVEPIDDVDLSISLSENMRVRSLFSVFGAFALLGRLSSASPEHDHLMDLPFYRITEFPDFELCAQWHNARRSLINICSRERWRRTWTVQEAVLPKSTLVYIGSELVTLSEFLWAANYLDKHDLFCCERQIGGMWEQKGRAEPSLKRALAPARSLGILIESYNTNMSFLNSPQPTSPVYRTPPKGGGLRHHQAFANERYATDLRDAVYGYLGIIPDLLPLRQKPEYLSETVGSLYAKTTKQYIIENHSLDVLESVLPPLLRAREGLPSWAVDWQHRNDSRMFPSTHHH